MGLNIQTALQLIYPPRCLICGTMVESDFGLCGPCWRDTPFVSGLSCDKCGVPLPGQASNQPEYCDDCLKVARPWDHGRAVAVYKDNARKLVLALKHGDRHDVVKPAALWMAHCAKTMCQPDSLLVPVPLHWTRMIKRKFNQSSLLAHAIAKHLNLSDCPDALHRKRRTIPLEGLGRDQRFEMLNDAIAVHRKRGHKIANRHVLLIDDVMTSGATLAAATEACLSGGAASVSVLVLARVAKDA